MMVHINIFLSSNHLQLRVFLNQTQFLHHHQSSKDLSSVDLFRLSFNLCELQVSPPSHSNDHHSLTDRPMNSYFLLGGFESASFQLNLMILSSFTGKGSDQLIPTHSPGAVCAFTDHCFVLQQDFFSTLKSLK